MAPKRAKFYSYGQDSLCAEVKEFIEKAGVILDVRDIEKEPLSVGEITRLFKHINIRHFLNTISDAYTTYRLDKNLPPREKIIELMAQDHSLIRRPIVQTARLLTVGCDRRKIAEMLQISASGNDSMEEVNGFGNRRNRNHRSVPAASGK